MVMEKLTSDKVNYLIWRYLQESNYADTALSLAKSWNQEDPDAIFNPNGYIKTHTLITILQKGLFYDDLERRTSREQNGAQGYFAPVAVPPTPPTQAEEQIIEARKRSVEETEPDVQSSSPSSKRPRLSDNNGDTTSPSHMDVDDQEASNSYTYPSPKEVDRSETPNANTNGAETAVQVDQPTDLIQNTTFLSISDEFAPSTPQLYHCKWNPRNASILAVAGADALIRFWNIPKPASVDDNHQMNGHFNGHNHDQGEKWHIGDETAPPSTYVSAFCWSPQGDTFAMATDTHDQDHAIILIYNTNSEVIRRYTTTGTPIFALAFNPPGDFVLGIGPDKSGGLSLTIMYVTSLHKTVMRNVMASAHMMATFYPRTFWTDDYEFLLCAADVLQSYQFNQITQKIEMSDKFELGVQPETITNVVYDPSSKSIATSTEDGEINIWSRSGQKTHNFSAHRERITSLAWQLPASSLIKSEHDNLLASASEDGTINIWEPRIAAQPKCSMIMDSAVQIVAFSPTGTHIAASTVKDTMIWNINDVSRPVAHWSRPSDAGFESPRSTASQAEDQLLCWDANGESLAFMVNNQIAITKFQED